MTKRGQIWKCELCGNIIEILHEGADNLVCCKQPMTLQEEERKEQEGNEKHVPVIEDKKVKVGSIPHPMEEKHYIEWIEATSESELEPCKKMLKPGNKPEVEFPFPVKQARAYCNIHGLWKSE
jgi:superoxide reductase